MHLTVPSHWSRSIVTGGRDESERVVTIVVARRDVAGIMIHQAEVANPRRAIDEVKSGGVEFIEGKPQPMTAEQADRAAKADAVRFLAALGLNT